MSLVRNNIKAAVVVVRALIEVVRIARQRINVICRYLLIIITIPETDNSIVFSVKIGAEGAIMTNYMTI